MNIKVLSKEKNPPNLPQLRPNETFFAHWKSIIYSNEWKPQNINELEEKAKRTLRTFGKEYYQKLMANVAWLERSGWHIITDHYQWSTNSIQNFRFLALI